ncbi:hypothetical protein G9272_16840 [Streptomyces asoensis]|uniref:Uncharacterized protein n=1 Tax=Streptomyces asoensis TaxID=249586 RepID=A0A6M4WPX6_9ACTN|nr:hypothetical protein [Streptomyces asoensis]QJT01771.1 hypothetical protein G9272_16840 [Streptomyces asoensis]
MTRHSRQRNVAFLGAVVLAAAAIVGGLRHLYPYALVLGFGVLVLTEAALRADRAHRREVREHDWARRQAVGENPGPLWPCCLLAEASKGEAHSPRCTGDLTTQQFLAIVAHLDDH